jgi:hypothetical protein
VRKIAEPLGVALQGSTEEANAVRTAPDYRR